MRPAALKLSRALVLLGVLLVAATACGSAQATKPCWRQVQDDWTANKLGSHTYRASCYDQAIKHLGGDVRYYSNAVDEIRAARQNAVKEKVRHTAGVSSGSSNNSSGGGSNSGGAQTDGGTDNAVGPIGDALNAGSSTADGMPLPLLILLGVAVLLVAAGAFGVASKHLHARREQQ